VEKTRLILSESGIETPEDIQYIKKNVGQMHFLLALV